MGIGSLTPWIMTSRMYKCTLFSNEELRNLFTESQRVQAIWKSKLVWLSQTFLFLLVKRGLDFICISSEGPCLLMGPFTWGEAVGQFPKPPGESRHRVRGVGRFPGPRCPPSFLQCTLIKCLCQRLVYEKTGPEITVSVLL